MPSLGWNKPRIATLHAYAPALQEVIKTASLGQFFAAGATSGDRDVVHRQCNWPASCRAHALNLAYPTSHGLVHARCILRFEHLICDRDRRRARLEATTLDDLGHSVVRRQGTLDHRSEEHTSELQSLRHL